MGFSEEQIFQFFTGIAYNPWQVYAVLILLMYMSSFGLPLPEEIILIATGFACFIGMNPALYPPPHEGAIPINPYMAAAVSFVAVITSDLLIFFIGKFLGQKLLKSKFMMKYETKISKVMKWTQKYGFWAAGIFRFTPGLRFPGHMSCGMMGVSCTRFLLVDGSAALVSVPTQVLLIAFFGQVVLEKIKHFKIALAILAILLILFFIIKKLYKYFKNKNRQTQSGTKSR